MPMNNKERRMLRMRHDLEQKRTHLKQLIDTNPQQFLQVHKLAEQMASDDTDQNMQLIASLAECFLLWTLFEHRHDKASDDD